ncbi:MAG: ATP-grasp domain-containing protein [Spirochaetales bacterium]|nr:ATP-grasp domain-containing protein [Spirochaetales bacterium]
MTRETKSIFILGAGVMQLPAIRAAKAMGWRVTVADGDPDAEGIPLADRFAHVDLKDLDAMTSAVKLCQADGGVDGVFTAGTDFSSTVAYAAERCGLPGISYETALNATDKGRMRKVLREHGVPQPDFIELARGERAEVALEKLSFPLVVKPVDNMGARGVRRIDTLPELKAAVSSAIIFSRAGRVIVEEYVDGSEYSLDAIVWRGKPALCGLAARHISFEPYFVEMGHTMPAVLDEQTKRKIVDVFFRGIRAIGIDNGAAKGDLKLSPSGPKVGEIAARLSGGYMSGWTYPYASGVDVTRSALRIAVGLPPLDLEPREAAWSAERAFISIPGRVARVDGVPEARAVPGVMDLFLRVRPGEDVVFPRNNVQKCGNVITRGQTRAGAVGAAVSALACISVRLAPARVETNAFLFSEASAGFDAWRPTVPENTAALDRLPGFRGDPGRFDPARPRVLDLPRRTDECHPDWHGVAPERLFRNVASACGVRFVPDAPSSGEFVLGGIFWKAFIKGSAQGAVYLLDTLASLAGKPAALSAFLNEESR